MLRPICISFNPDINRLLFVSLNILKLRFNNFIVHAWLWWKKLLTASFESTIYVATSFISFLATALMIFTLTKNSQSVFKIIFVFIEMESLARTVVNFGAMKCSFKIFVFLIFSESFWATKLKTFQIYLSKI